ncbi:exodeoxyribonuclease III [Conexibacter sp. DBS9H8]|uniref:exodeoxyribonuclease III n=1 Tax=Conexibacter sp. DBS9H8 TaxID=2937801 RepID=UPI002010233C|nr:exodeoxyribonuclease III [Conexibacter sp. DBS9H8]
MLVVTWNVNSLRARLPRVLELLARHRPDVVCLQETKCRHDQFPLAEIAAAGYAAAHHSAGPWAGVALLVRAAPSAAPPDGADPGDGPSAAAGPDGSLHDTVVGLSGEPVVEEARWLEATVAGVRVISTYVPNGRSLDSPEFPRKLAFLEAAARRIGTLRAAGMPIILAGDLNIAPQDRDLYDPAVFADGTHVTNEERSRLAAIEKAGGLLDAYRHRHPETQQFTWWDYRAGHFHKGLGLRIDLVLISASLAPRLRECGIDRDFRKGPRPSDHAPLLVRLDD